MLRELQQAAKRVSGFDEKAGEIAAKIRSEVMNMLAHGSLEVSHREIAQDLRKRMNEWLVVCDLLEKDKKMDGARVQAIHTRVRAEGSKRLVELREGRLTKSTAALEKLYAKKRPIDFATWKELGDAAEAAMVIKGMA